MLLEAAKGNTAKEILRALNISTNSLPDLRIGFKVYCDTFEVSACVNLSVCPSTLLTLKLLTFIYFLMVTPCIASNKYFIALNYMNCRIVKN